MEATPLQSHSITAVDEGVTDEGVSCIDVYLPRTLDRWPWPRRESPHHASVTQEASSWCESFQAFSPKAQEAFNKCNFSMLQVQTLARDVLTYSNPLDLLAALVYPALDRG